MSVEYWLQKKTISGWSMVTSYQDVDQAWRNYDSCVGNGMSGYSWRLVKVETIKEDMLNDVVTITGEQSAINAQNFVWGGERAGLGISVQDAPKSSWGTPSLGWGEFKTPINPEADTGPSEGQLTPEQQADVNNAWGNFKTCNTVSAHGNIGKVWLVHYGLKDKKRVAANLVDDMIAQGWVRGGPRTQFEG